MDNCFQLFDNLKSRFHVENPLPFNFHGFESAAYNFIS